MARGWQEALGTARHKPADAPAAPLSPFTRLARTHALMTSIDAIVAVGLAGSLFFDINPNAARSKVALYLLITVAPFAVVAPLVGPALDRLAGGRRAVVVACAAGRIVVCLLMAVHIKSLLLYPEAFATLVLSKAYAVSKSALVPTVVRSKADLVEANSKLGVIAGVMSFTGAIPAAVLQAVSASATMVLAAVVAVAALFSALQLPKGSVVAAEKAAPEEKVELRSAGIVLAASAMGFLRATVGFLTFQVAFWFRHEGTKTAWFGVVLMFSGIGTLVGNGLGPMIRRHLREETMLVAALGVTAVAGVLAGLTGGTFSAALLAGFVGLSAATGRLAFESIVGRDAPDANRGRAFAQFETRFQLLWVLAAAVPVVLQIPGSVGFFLVGAIAAFAMLSYLWGSHVVRLRGQLPETMTMRARRLARTRAPAALRARRPAGGPETEPEARTDGRESTSLPPPAPPGTADRPSPPAPPDLVDLTSGTPLPPPPPSRPPPPS